MSPSTGSRTIVALIAGVLLWGVGAPAARSAPTGVPSTAAEGLTWQRVPTDTAIAGGAGRGLKLRTLTTVPGGFVAAGGDARGAVILRSTNGVQWTTARDNAAFDFASVRAVAGTAALTIAVGTRSGSNRGLLWTSADGLTWRDGGYAFAGNIEVVGAAAGPAAYVVAGAYRTPPDASGSRRLVGAVWTSADGRSWDRFVMPADTALGDFRLTFITYAGSRFIALGRASDSGAHPGMLVWTSADGRHWQRGRDMAIPREGTVDDVAQGPTGALLAVGRVSASPAHAAAFTSSDGLQWTPVPDAPSLQGAAMRGLACNQQRCLTVGQSAGGSPALAATWSTVDGSTWSPTGSLAALGDAGMSDVALTATGAVAIGWAVALFEGAPYVDNAAFWTTPPVVLPDPILPPPAPMVAGHWESLPPMSTARIYPVAAVGRDGRIYVFGGKTRPGGTGTPIQTSSVEIFDPRTNAWSSGTPIPGPGRIRAAAVTSADGRIFLFHTSSRLVLIYNPATATWATGPSIPTGPHVFGAAAGPGSLLSVVGEKLISSTQSSRWLYTLDPATGAWRSRGATGAVPAAMGADGLLYGATGSRAWSIDPTTGRTNPRRATPEFADFTAAALGPAGLIWEAGVAYVHPSGIRSAQWSRPVVQAFDPSTNSWLVAPRPAVLRWWQAVTGTGDRLYVIGGSTGTYTNAAEVFVVDNAAS